MEKSGNSVRWGGESADRLKQQTIETILPDTPYVVVPEQYTSLKETIWIDVDDGQEAIAIGKSESAKPLMTGDYDLGGNLMIVMRVWIRDESGRLIEGLVADMRWVSTPLDRLDLRKEAAEAGDVEEQMGAIKMDSNKVRIAAYVDRDEEGDVYYGDRRFGEVVEFLRDKDDEILEMVIQETEEETDELSNGSTENKPKVEVRDES